MNVFHSVAAWCRAQRTTLPLADQAVQQLRRQLRGKVNATILAQAEARLRRRLFQGIERERAIAHIVAWAMQAQHADWALGPVLRRG
jgi:hypothetical protein